MYACKLKRIYQLGEIAVKVLQNTLNNVSMNYKIFIHHSY